MLLVNRDPNLVPKFSLDQKIALNSSMDLELSKRNFHLSQGPGLTVFSTYLFLNCTKE